MTSSSSKRDRDSGTGIPLENIFTVVVPLDGDVTHAPHLVYQIGNACQSHGRISSVQLWKVKNDGLSYIVSFEELLSSPVGPITLENGVQCQVERPSVEDAERYSLPSEHDDATAGPRGKRARRASHSYSISPALMTKPKKDQIDRPFQASPNGYLVASREGDIDLLPSLDSVLFCSHHSPQLASSSPPPTTAPYEKPVPVLADADHLVATNAGDRNALPPLHSTSPPPGPPKNSITRVSNGSTTLEKTGNTYGDGDRLVATPLGDRERLPSLRSPTIPNSNPLLAPVPSTSPSNQLPKNLEAQSSQRMTLGEFADSYAMLQKENETLKVELQQLRSMLKDQNRENVPPNTERETGVDYTKE